MVSDGHSVYKAFEEVYIFRGNCDIANRQ